MSSVVMSGEWKNQISRMTSWINKAAPYYSPFDRLERVRFNQTNCYSPASQDLLVQCPKCKTFETLQFIGDNLAPCRKFFQRDGKIFHDCGSGEPCHLHGR
jgi:hypothetical protein